MKYTLAGIVCLAMIIFAASAGTAPDAKALEGTWVLVYLERDGKEIKPKTETRAIIKGNNFEIVVGDKVIAGGTSKLNPSKKPKEVDSTYTEGPDKGKSFKGIYHLDGDTAKFCRAGSPDQPRPTEFKTKPGRGGLFTIYKRAKR